MTTFYVFITFSSINQLFLNIIYYCKFEIFTSTHIPCKLFSSITLINISWRGLINIRGACHPLELYFKVNSNLINSSYTKKRWDQFTLENFINYLIVLWTRWKQSNYLASKTYVIRPINMEMWYLLEFQYSISLNFEYGEDEIIYR